MSGTVDEHTVNAGPFGAWLLRLRALAARRHRHGRALRRLHRLLYLRLLIQPAPQRRGGGARGCRSGSGSRRRASAPGDLTLPAREDRHLPDAAGGTLLDLCGTPADLPRLRLPDLRRRRPRRGRRRQAGDQPARPRLALRLRGRRRAARARRGAHAAARFIRERPRRSRRVGVRPCRPASMGIGGARDQ